MNTINMDEAAYTLKAIAHGTRLNIIALLTTQEELNVSQLGILLQFEQSLLSHHLTDMRAKGILNSPKIATTRISNQSCLVSTSVVIDISPI